MTDHHKLRVAVVGGGIGGLSFAVSLRKLCGSRVEIDIYEAAHAFTEVGAGIGLWPRVWHTMEALGLADDLSAIATSSGFAGQGQQIELRKSDHTTYGGSTLNVPSTLWTQLAGTRGFHRAEFLAVLNAHLPPDPSYTAHFHKRLASYATSPSDSDATILTFADGSTAVCDLLVGCDGIRSAVRATMYHLQPTSVDPIWSGSVAYRSLVPREALAKAYPEHPLLTKSLQGCGRNKHVVAYPISRGESINIVAFVTNPEGEGTKYDGAWTREASKQEILDEYAGWEPWVVQLFDCVERASAWVINVAPKLPTYVGERVALLGDAAHAMTPHQGSGAGQAIEDGYILASLLADPRATRQTLPRVLQVYDSIRRPFSQYIVERSRATGMLCDYILSPSELGDDVDLSKISGDSEADDLEKRSSAIQQLLLWASETTIMGDRDRALQAFDAALIV